MEVAGFSGHSARLVILGGLPGLVTAFLVAQLKHPLFRGLAGRLANLPRARYSWSTEGTGTIVIPNAAFNAIGNGFIPDLPNFGLA